MSAVVVDEQGMKAEHSIHFRDATVLARTAGFMDLLVN
jgi:hypothetical protein